MASFVANGDPGCNNKNWLTKAPTAVGPSGDPATFNPTKLDTDQWARVYADAGVKGAVVTAKHGCGHLLWPTKVTLDSGAPYTYCVGKKDSAIKQDVLALFSASMTKANITHVRAPLWLWLWLMLWLMLWRWPSVVRTASCNQAAAAHRASTRWMIHMMYISLAIVAED